MTPAPIILPTSSCVGYRLSAVGARAMGWKGRCASHAARSASDSRGAAAAARATVRAACAARAAAATMAASSFLRAAG